MTGIDRRMALALVGIGGVVASGIETDPLEPVKDSGSGISRISPNVWYVGEEDVFVHCTIEARSKGQFGGLVGVLTDYPRAARHRRDRRLFTFGAATVNFDANVFRNSFTMHVPKTWSFRIERDENNSEVEEFLYVTGDFRRDVETEKSISEDSR